MNLILCGPKNSGKSTVGKHLAKQLGFAFYDLDRLVAEKHGVSCLEVVQTHGEMFFRKEEKEILFSLKGTKHTVVSLGGGAVLDEESREFVKDLGKVIYLQISLATFKRRLRGRPLPTFLDQSRPFRSMREMLMMRQSLYEQVAEVIVDANREKCRWLATHLVRSLELQPLENRTGK